MLRRKSSGEAFSQAWAAFAEAFNLLALGNGGNNRSILSLADRILAEIGPADASQPGGKFLSGRIQDAQAYAGLLRSRSGVSRSDLGTLLLALEFVLRTAQYQAERRETVDECRNCGSPHVIAQPSPKGDGPAFRCVSCGLVTTHRPPPTS